MRKRLFLIPALLLILAATAACESGSGQYATVEGLSGLIENRDAEYLLLDVRTPEEYRTGHIPTAVNIDYRQLEARAAELPADRNLPVVVYCRSGRRSAVAARTLADLGFTNVHDFGGIIDWPGRTVAGTDP